MKDLVYMIRRLFRQRMAVAVAVLLTAGQCALKLWLPKMMEDNIKVLKELGFSFSLDDYGQGYSNMDNVSHMPVEMIKLDRSLTASENPEMKVMFEHSLKMIRDLKKEVVIEGVETEEILSKFETSLCDYIQGYYFSKPLPKEDFISFLYEKKGIKMEEKKPMDAECKEEAQVENE